jgi:hypothetical protein
VTAPRRLVVAQGHLVRRPAGVVRPRLRLEHLLGQRLEVRQVDDVDHRADTVARVAVRVFAVWTFVVWGTRIRNILSDDGSTLALAVAVGLTALGLLVAVHAATRRLPWSVPAAALATVVVWAVRAPQVLLHDHSGGFKAVHLLLAVLSIALALFATQDERDRADAARV